jgi:cytochrome b involved in lipid metabolism
MQNKYLYLGILLIVGLMVAGITMFMLREDTTAPDNREQDDIAIQEADVNTTDEEEVIIDDIVYNLEQIAEHNNPQDCWFAIDGKVYDVTEYIAGGKHPGGEAVVLGCGLDATELFTNKVDQGINHSDRAWNFLENFYIGILSE